jgi:hypothetical protein
MWMRHSHQGQRSYGHLGAIFVGQGEAVEGAAALQQLQAGGTCSMVMVCARV